MGRLEAPTTGLRPATLDRLLVALGVGEWAASLPPGHAQPDQ